LKLSSITDQRYLLFRFFNELIKINVKIIKQKDKDDKNTIKKLDIAELLKGNSKMIANKLKNDLKDLTWMIKNNDNLKDDVKDDDAILMVIIFIKFQ
jgi:hypothetical protein